MNEILAEPLTRAGFAPFGDVIDAEGENRFFINNGMTERIHDLARPQVEGPDAHVTISIARGKPYDFPLDLKMVERHPLGSQAFVPLSPASFLVVVCADIDGTPGTPLAFLTGPGQGVNYHRNIWHSVLTPIGAPQDFLIVDRGGEGGNLEEFFFKTPWRIHLPAG